jgi:hypothetical protein
VHPRNAARLELAAAVPADLAAFLETLSGDVQSGPGGVGWDARVMFDVAAYLRSRR